MVVRTRKSGVATRDKRGRAIIGIAFTKKRRGSHSRARHLKKGSLFAGTRKTSSHVPVRDVKRRFSLPGNCGYVLHDPDTFSLMINFGHAQTHVKTTHGRRKGRARDTYTPTCLEKCTNVTTSCARRDASPHPPPPPTCDAMNPRPSQRIESASQVAPPPSSPL